jgi:hypothetical protein
MFGRLGAVLATLALAAGGCAKHVSYAEQTRRTADAGTILIHPGEGQKDAVKRALADIAAHCKGPYEVVEIAKTGTGRTSSSGSAVAAYGVAYGESASTAEFGTALAYVCRAPASVDLNMSLAEFAFVGRYCATESDCWGLPCLLSPSWIGERCTSRSGLPVLSPADRAAQEAKAVGQKCDPETPCPLGLVCKVMSYKTYGYCVGSAAPSD